MALRNILRIGEPTLEKKSRPVQNFDARLHTLLDDMAETLHEVGGAGLAAPQVGILRRVCIVECEEDNLIELINPEIVKSEGEQEGNEGCLSLPGRYGIVRRPMKVTLRAQDRHGHPFEITGEGLTARAFCHEVEHLDGVLFTAHVERYLEPDELAAMEEEE